MAAIGKNESDWKPSRQQILAAGDGRVPDILAPSLRVLFCGINPGLYSAAVGHHFARPGNRFWPALHASGFTERLFAPPEERELLSCGCGITNLVARASATAAELSALELEQGAQVLVEKVLQYRPRALAVLGVGAYAKAFGKRGVTLGPQGETIGGTALWVLPNPSGLNAHYQLGDLAQLFEQLRLSL